MKHIKVKYHFDDGDIFLEVVEQTHIAEDFGKHGTNSFCGSKMKLQSVYEPEWDGYADQLFVRGSEVEYDDNLVRIPDIETVLKINQTIEEYNEYFKERS